MMMYKVKTGLAHGLAATEEMAVANAAKYHVENDRVPENDMYVDVYELDPELLWGDEDVDHWEPEEWCEDSWQVKIPLETFKQMGRRRTEMEENYEETKSWSESELEIENNGWDYWVVSKDTGTIVAQRGRIEDAKEARDECNGEWDDGEEYEVIQKGPEEEMGTTLNQI